MTSLTDFAAMSKHLLEQEAPKVKDIADTGEYLASLTPDLASATPADFATLEALANTADIRATFTRVAAYALEEGEGKSDPYLEGSGLPADPEKCREISNGWFGLSDALRTVIAV